MTQTYEADRVQLRDEIQRQLMARFLWFEKRYDLLSHHAFERGSDRIFLGDRSKQVCRYCGFSPPQVKFKKLAHAIPDQIGNDWLFDHQECDNCNEHFSKLVEDDFAKWTLPWRALGRISGKSGVPSLKSNDKQFRIDAAQTRVTDDEFGDSTVRYDLKIQMAINDMRHERDESNRTVKLTLDRQPYVPMGVFKCLVKMAIAVMPKAEEDRSAHLKKWILRTEHTLESYSYKPFDILYQFAPGPLPNDKVSYWLLRRKPYRPTDCFYMQFVLQLGNHVFQIALPMHVEDWALRKFGHYQSSLWPNSWAGPDHQAKYGLSDHRIFDMSGTEQVRGEMTFMTFTYDKIVGYKEFKN